MSSPGNEAESPEQKGKKCCNNANRISQTVNNLLIQITRLLSTRAAGIQTRTNEIMEPCCKQLKEKVDSLEERMNKVQRSVQDQLINAYAMANAKAQQLMQSPQPRTQEEEESEPESQGQATKTPSMAEQRDAIQKREQQESSTSSPQRESNVPQSPTPKTPSSGKETPQATKKRSPECLEIDWCEPFYIWLEQWQKQNIEQQQRSQESLRECCPSTPEAREKEEKDLHPFVLKASLEYEEQPIEKGV